MVSPSFKPLAWAKKEWMITSFNFQDSLANCFKIKSIKIYVGQEEIAAFGDGSNDTMMLKTVGMGVAMANAMPEVKAAADRLTDSNDEEGVARFIEKYILKTE